MNAPIKPDSLFTAWSRGQWKPAYLFTGPEDFLIEEALRRLYASKLPHDPNNLNKDRLDGEEHASDAILEACQTVPFLGNERVVEVQNTSRLSAEEQRRLAQGLSKLPPNTTLALIWGKEWRRDDAHKPLVEAVLQRGEVVIFWPPFPEQAQRWLLDRATRQYQKSLALDAAAWLVHQTGEGLRLLDQELFKSSLYVGGRPTIELADVQAAYGYDKVCSPYEWIHAVRQKNGPLALKTFRRLLEEGEEPLHLLAIATGSLRDWLIAKSSGDSAPALAMRFHLRKGEEHRFFQDLTKLPEEELTEGLSACVETEQSIKTGKETPEMALTLLTLRLCRLQPVHALG